jgi:hypothetical protein
VVYCIWRMKVASRWLHYRVNKSLCIIIKHQIISLLNTIIVLIYHRQKPIDLITNLIFIYGLTTPSVSGGGTDAWRERSDACTSYPSFLESKKELENK